MLRSGVQLNPLDGKFIWFYAQLAQDLDQELVRSDITRAERRTHPRMRPLDFLLGARTRLGDDDAARALFDAGILRDCGESRSTPTADNCRAWYYMLAGRKLDEAQRLVDEAIEAEGSRSDFLDTKAMVHLAKGEVDQALEAAIAAAKMAPSDPYMLWQAERIAARLQGPPSPCRELWMRWFVLLFFSAWALAYDTQPTPETARVVSVYDGDTFTLDNGDKVRLRWVNTPEKRPKEPFADEATRFTRDFVEGQEVRLIPAARPRDAYGRLVAGVSNEKGNLSVALVRAASRTSSSSRQTTPTPAPLSKRKPRRPGAPGNLVDAHRRQPHPHDLIPQTRATTSATPPSTCASAIRRSSPSTLAGSPE